MKTDKYTKEEVNQAIFTVLTASYVKDAPEAFKIVKAAGYEYDKFRGQFRVRNFDTDKVLEIGGFGSRIEVIRYDIKNYDYKSVSISSDDPMLFDYVGFLDKPVNDEYDEYWRYEGRTIHSKSIEQYYRLSNAKRWVKSCEDTIKRLNNEMTDLQKRLSDEKKRLSVEKKRLSDIRKEFGLSHS